MPKEIRQIVFSPGELMDAIVANNRTLEEKVLYGDIASCTLGEDLVVRASCQVRDGSVVRKSDVTLTQEFVLESLVRYCLENNIPVPRSATKQVCLHEGDPCLKICFTTKL